jgi:hypothetical protein
MPFPTSVNLAFALTAITGMFEIILFYLIEAFSMHPNGLFQVSLYPLISNLGESFEQFQHHQFH